MLLVSADLTYYTPSRKNSQLRSCLLLCLNRFTALKEEIVITLSAAVHITLTYCPELHYQYLLSGGKTSPTCSFQFMAFFLSFKIM